MFVLRNAKGTHLYNRWAYIPGGGLISGIISLLANRRDYIRGGGAYNLGGFDAGFYGM